MKVAFWRLSGDFSDLDAFWCHFCPQTVSNPQMYPKMIQKSDPTDTNFRKYLQVGTPKLEKGFDVVFQGRRVSRSVFNMCIYTSMYILLYSDTLSNTIHDGWMDGNNKKRALGSRSAIHHSRLAIHPPWMVLDRIFNTLRETRRP